MFIHKTHLPHLLTPDHYCSDEQSRRERAELFEPAWHPVAATDEVRQDGELVTRELLGRPLIIWNRGGEVRVFLNVCSHRYCRLTARAESRCDKLQCQYHGWQYNHDGDVQRIPDAQSFRPLARGQLGLKRFTAEVCGGVVFVSFDDDSAPLEKFLGPGYERCERMTGGARRLILYDEGEEAFDWKLLMENAVESYHVEMIHAKSFGRYPDAENCRHELGDGWSQFVTWGDPPRGLASWIGRRFEGLLGAQWPTEYVHHHTYPHVMIGTYGPYGWVHTAYPAAAGRLRWRLMVYADAGARGGVANGIARRLLKRHGRRFFKQVVAEDLGVLREMQRGLACGEQPTGGLISVREERIWHFQKWVLGGDRSESGPPSAQTHQAAPRAEAEQMGT